MEWHQIVNFNAIVELDTMTRAAEATFRTQSALSQQIAKLESELGCKLFHRIGKSSFRLTNEGEAFLQFAKNVLRQEKKLKTRLLELSETNAGRIVLAAPHAVMSFLLPAPLQEYKRLYPNVECNLIQKTPQECVEFVLNGNADVCITHQSAAPKTMQSIPWYMGRFMLIAPKGHPVEKLDKIMPEDLLPYPLNLPEKNAKFSARDRFDLLFAERGLTYTLALETPNSLLSLQYAMMNFGISFMLCYRPMIEEYSDRLNFIPMEHLFPNEGIVIAMRKDTWIPGYKQKFLDILDAARVISK